MHTIAGLAQTHKQEPNLYLWNQRFYRGGKDCTQCGRAQRVIGNALAQGRKVVDLGRGGKAYRKNDKLLIYFMLPDKLGILRPQAMLFQLTMRDWENLETVKRKMLLEAFRFARFAGRTPKSQAWRALIDAAVQQVDTKVRGTQSAKKLIMLLSAILVSVTAIKLLFYMLKKYSEPTAARFRLSLGRLAAAGWAPGLELSSEHKKLLEQELKSLPSEDKRVLINSARAVRRRL